MQINIEENEEITTYTKIDTDDGTNIFFFLSTGIFFGKSNCRQNDDN